MPWSRRRWYAVRSSLLIDAQPVNPSEKIDAPATTHFLIMTYPVKNIVQVCPSNSGAQLNRSLKLRAGTNLINVQCDLRHSDDDARELG